MYNLLCFSAAHQDAVIFYLLINLLPNLDTKGKGKRKRIAEDKENLSQEITENRLVQTNVRQLTGSEKRESYMVVIPVRVSVCSQRLESSRI